MERANVFPLLEGIVALMRIMEITNGTECAEILDRHSFSCIWDKMSQLRNNNSWKLLLLSSENLDGAGSFEKICYDLCWKRNATRIEIKANRTFPRKMV